ncbi:hypothetical protein [Entomospira culicis]|uniref:Tetratricopeptide repeat-containing protein n=1 Tax=Entomospira culicis TaxID=2719989 RepID=A0A968GIL2_9SPIO|nr:hypothetical protein [Entomospira culicis]NIZ19116.1 hypothetical protein [Entomospira culicis]NIZ69330.1 hypothetical protein [Entomospira culicis]WDI39543.1 hypothetical protein PVA47_03770 [Entomospira culicis]
MKLSTFVIGRLSAQEHYQLALDLMIKKPSPLHQKVVIQLLSRAIELESCHALAYLQRATLRYQRILSKKGSGNTTGLRKKLLKTIEDLTKYTMIIENDPQAYLLRAQNYLLLTRYDKYASIAFLEDFEKARALNADLHELKSHVAWIGLQAARYTGDYQQALHYLDLSYDGNFDHNYFIRRSVIFDEMGNAEESAADILRANSKAVLARAFERITLFDEAESILLKQIELSPQNIWPKIRLAQFYERIDHLESARDTYAFVLKQLHSTHRYYSVISHEINKLDTILNTSE